MIEAGRSFIDSSITYQVEGTMEMINTAAMSIPRHVFIERTVSVTKPISAVQLVKDERQGTQLGALSQLRPGATLEVCGEGFNERTVKVRYNDCFYFVFRQDIGDRN
jgi:hypothetical protein